MKKLFERLMKNRYFKELFLDSRTKKHKNLFSEYQQKIVKYTLKC